MKIALVEPRPPFNTYYFFKKLPLLGGLFLGAILKEVGHEVRVFKEDFGPVLREKNGWLHPYLAAADAVGITAITHTANRAYRIADAVRAASPRTRIIMGGAHPSALPDEALQHADQVVTGEGESVVRDVFEGRRRERIVPGPRVDIDTVPMVDLSLLQGVRARRGKPDLPIAPMMASRGCPYDCVFCSVTKMFGRRYRVRNSDLVLEEVLRRHGEGFRWGFFYDDNFAASPEKTKIFLEKLIRADIDFSWNSQFSVHVARDRELLRLLKRAGCARLFIGVESFNPAALRDYGKSQTVEVVRSSIETIISEGLAVHSMFILGADSDDEDAIDTTIRFSRESGSRTAQFSILFPIPGTELYTRMVEQKRILVDTWDYFDGSHAVLRPRLISPYRLQQKLIHAYKYFYGARPLHWLVSRVGFLLWKAGNRGYLRFLRGFSKNSL
ncbi:MAG TPA: radical SAM protein [Spirochaetia bacterium]|nr:radical SAM protein [Spirochaetia bacterium]